MIKWFVYLVFLLVFTPCLLLAKINRSPEEGYPPLARVAFVLPGGPGKPVADTIKSLKAAAKGDTKVKEVPNAKRQPKPGKVEDNAQPAVQKEKPKRERRPDGMERPPEIPRRNDN